MAFRAKYLGDHSNFAAWGIHFPRGVYVPVNDEAAQKKISANCHFEVESIDAEDVEFVETVKDEFAGAQQEAEMHGEGTPVERQKRPYNRRK